jgi:hypothetical protein
VTFWVIFHCLWVIFSQKPLVTLFLLSHLVQMQGDQIGQCFTNKATFCRLIEAISPKNVNILGY